MYTGVELELGTPGVAELITFVAASTGLAVKPDSGISVKEISASASRADRALRVHLGTASTAAGR